MPYVEGFLTPVPLAKREDYLAFTRKAAPLFKDIGVTRMVECWGDDLMKGEHTDLIAPSMPRRGKRSCFPGWNIRTRKLAMRPIAKWSRTNASLPWERCRWTESG